MGNYFDGVCVSGGMWCVCYVVLCVEVGGFLDQVNMDGLCDDVIVCLGIVY